MGNEPDRQAVLRTLVVVAILIATILVGSYFGHDWSGPGRFAIVGGFVLLGLTLLGLLNYAAKFRLFPFALYRYHFSVLFSLGCTLTIYSAGSTTTPAVATYIPAIVLSTMLWGLGAGAASTALSIGGYTAVWTGEVMGWLPYAPFYPSKAALGTQMHVATVAYMWMLATCLFSLLFAHYFKSVYDRRTEQREAAISDLRSANRRLATMQRELARSESLAAVGSLAAGAAHEINNPLGSVYSLLQSLAEEIAGASDDGGRAQVNAGESGETLTLALKELRRTRRIVEALSELSQERDGASEPFDFNELVRAEVAKEFDGRSLSLTWRLSEALPRVVGDRERIGRALGHILANAREATQGRPEPRVLIGTEVCGSNVRFCCEDNGPGIPPASREEVFRPFFTTKRDRKAPGLGLFLVHQASEQWGGRAWVEPSGEGGGARLYLELPGQP